jgi:hypothetical protein
MRGVRRHRIPSDFSECRPGNPGSAFYPSPPVASRSPATVAIPPLRVLQRLEVRLRPWCSPGTVGQPPTSPRRSRSSLPIAQIRGTRATCLALTRITVPPRPALEAALISRSCGSTRDTSELSTIRWHGYSPQNRHLVGLPLSSFLLRPDSGGCLPSCSEVSAARQESAAEAAPVASNNRMQLTGRGHRIVWGLAPPAVALHTQANAPRPCS